MRRKTKQDLSVNAIEKSLKNREISENILLLGYNIILDALNEPCCNKIVDVTIKAKSFQENNFISLIREVVIKSKNSKAFKRTLTQLKNVVSTVVNDPCCLTTSSIEINTNHIASGNIATEGYASIESGGTLTNISYKITGKCIPYNVRVEVDFGLGSSVYEEINNIQQRTYTRNINNALNSFIGKQVNINGILYTVIPDNESLGPNQINLNYLNGRIFTFTITVTDCNGEETSFSESIEFEMKRVTKIVAYARQQDNNECRCANILADTYPDRRGGSTFAGTTPVLGSTLPTYSINGQNVFNNLFAGGANAKWRFSDFVNTLDGFHTDIMFRNPFMRVIDTLIEAGLPTDTNCIYTIISVDLDVRESDIFNLVPVIHQSNVNCATEPITFNAGSAYNMSATLLDRPIVNGNTVILGFDIATIINITTPTALGW
jgi:hypothetical protein